MEFSNCSTQVLTGFEQRSEASSAVKQDHSKRSVEDADLRKDTRESIRVVEQLAEEIDTAMAEHVLEEAEGAEEELGGDGAGNMRASRTILGVLAGGRRRHGE
jgi:hypothetical protein